MTQIDNPARGTPVPYRKATLARMGASLGIAANCIGWGIFLALCHGFSAAAVLAPLPLLLGIAGMVLTIVGGVTQPHQDVDTHILASMFLNLFGIVGGLLEM